MRSVLDETAGSDAQQWIDVGASGEVAPRQAAAVTAAGVDLVLWRAAHGRLGACERRCPHLQADLAAEGVVAGDELVCGAHFWRIDLQGLVCKQNMDGRRDLKGTVPMFECTEVEGRILLRPPGAGGQVDLGAETGGPPTR